MSGTGDIEAFIIHLARAEARRAQVDRIVAACPVPTHIIDAVDGRGLSRSEKDAVYSRKSRHAPPYPFDMTAGEIGCFLSHRKAWKAILDRGLEAGLVIEDDVEIDAAAFERALVLARGHIAAHGIVQFQVRSIAEPGQQIASANGVVLNRPVIVPLRASCTLYSPAALERLLAQTARFDRPIDGHVQLHWVTGLRPLIAVPSGVCDKGGEIGGTTIQARNVPLLRRLRRELQRPLYRARISALSRAHDRPPA
jgi:glycosyl transferase family 25